MDKYLYLTQIKNGFLEMEKLIQTSRLNKQMEKIISSDCSLDTAPGTSFRHAF